jgi:hypothetical protein
MSKEEDPYADLKQHRLIPEIARLAKKGGAFVSATSARAGWRDLRQDRARQRAIPRI